MVEEHSIQCLAEKVECFLGCGKVLSGYIEAKDHFPLCPSALCCCPLCDSILPQAQLGDHSESDCIRFLKNRVLW